MSAIAKPLAKFTNAINNTTTVPVECVQAFEKQDIPNLPNTPSNSAEYNLVITVLLPGSVQAKQIVIKFATSGARDTSFTNFETTFCASVA